MPAGFVDPKDKLKYAGGRAISGAVGGGIAGHILGLGGGKGALLGALGSAALGATKGGKERGFGRGLVEGVLPGAGVSGATSIAGHLLDAAAAHAAGQQGRIVVRMHMPNTQRASRDMAESAIEKYAESYPNHFGFRDQILNERKIKRLLRND